MTKDEHEIPALENECIQGDRSIEGDRMKTELNEGKQAEWLAKFVKVVGSEEVIDKHTNVSWAVFSARQAPQIKIKVQLQILPVFAEASNTLAIFMLIL